MTDDKLTIRSARGARAQALLDDELIKEAFDTLARTYLDAWTGTTITDQDRRERLWHAVKVLGDVKKHLKLVVQDGQLAKVELERMIDAEARKKRFGII